MMGNDNGCGMRAASRGGEPPQCGLHVALAVMGGKWKPLILYYLSDGSQRFGDLRRLVAGISEKVLTQQLRELAAAGVVIRHDYQENPPKVDYTITTFGKTLARALMPLCEWGTEHQDRVGAVAASRVRVRDATGASPRGNRCSGTA